MSGSTPQGSRNEQEAAHWVRGMFGRVAHRYDLANHLLSFNIDRYWRAHTVRRTRDILDRPEARVLDICCGTGDLVLALAKRGRPVLGSDFCHPMLVAAHDENRAAPRSRRAVRIRRAGPPVARCVARPDHRGLRLSQSRELPVRPARNAPCAAPRAAWRRSSSSPSRRMPPSPRSTTSTARRVLPWIGGLISGSRDAYTYLPESVRKFPVAPELAAMMRRAGFADVSFEYLTGGIVALHLGRIT